MKQNRRKMMRMISSGIALIMIATLLVLLVASPFVKQTTALAKDDVITLRVCNWEEYIDLGEWDEEELIELDNGVSIFGEQTMMDDFCNWYYETYGKRVEIEYSCFGTNEDLYNQLTLGDTYDLVCPSEYMIMKLMAEDMLQPLSEEFFDETNENNYYIRGVSPFIREAFETNEINGSAWSEYAAGFMWGVTGILYNPEEMTEEDASTWNVFNNPDYYRRITIKDNVRDSYFAAVAACKDDLLLSDDFINAPDYQERLAIEMNDVSKDTIKEAQDLLQDWKDNVYAFETDSGKADIVSGKIAANYQWSGDAVYAMDLAEEDDVYLEYAVPKECTNLWFDGWVMLKDGIKNDVEKQHAAEAFINFVSMPENAVRNMYYIGYTSVISGGEDDTVFEYLNWCYGAEEDAEDVVSYPVGFFFAQDNEDENYVIEADAEQTKRQLFAQYPPQEVLERSAIMQYFDETASKDANQMWINVRCFNIKDVSFSTWLLIAAVLCLVIAVAQRIRADRYKG
ncbi:MAG: extracellular solute-binding protein [Eubacteriales bacterium]|nr:extracellular solute-binding protein [Lachnospiraceae bacterium]MDO5127416.1 extracellular solute-binding protein [Eubacteriales bacterium]